MNQVMERPVRRAGATDQPLVLGIDFGTSNSAAALIGADGRLQVVPLGERSGRDADCPVFCQ